MKQDVIDLIVDRLGDKQCPLHNCGMIKTAPFITGTEYMRDRFKCPHCDCKVDFVGDEIKTDKAADTLIYINACGGYSSPSISDINVKSDK